jgi:hypothetical protein
MEIERERGEDQVQCRLREREGRGPEQIRRHGGERDKDIV